MRDIFHAYELFVFANRTVLEALSASLLGSPSIGSLEMDEKGIRHLNRKGKQHHMCSSFSLGFSFWNLGRGWGCFTAFQCFLRLIHMKEGALVDFAIACLPIPANRWMPIIAFFSSGAGSFHIVVARWLIGLTRRRGPPLLGLTLACAFLGRRAATAIFTIAFSAASPLPGDLVRCLFSGAFSSVWVDAQEQPSPREHLPVFCHWRQVFGSHFGFGSWIESCIVRLI